MEKVGRLRYGYDRLTAEEFRNGLEGLGMSPVEFARISGTGAPKRVDEWISGDQEIPHDANVLLTIFEEVPGAIDVARELADEYGEAFFRDVKVPENHPLAQSKRARKGNRAGKESR